GGGGPAGPCPRPESKVARCRRYRPTPTAADRASRRGSIAPRRAHLALGGVGPDDPRELDQARDQDFADHVLADPRQALKARQADVERVPGLRRRHPRFKPRLETPPDL